VKPLTFATKAYAQKKSANFPTITQTSQTTREGMSQSVRSPFLPSPLQILSQSNIHQFPLLPRFTIRFNQPLCEFLEFYI
jgi:hypothetical protein